MENGPVTLGLEDGAIDVARLLVEPQDGHVSMDSVMCFNEKIPDNSLSMEEVSCSFGGSNHDFAEQGKDILNGEVLDGMPGEEVGYFRLQNDFCSMGDEYLLGVEFAESITNLDYSSSERLQTSVSDSLILASCAGTGSPWKSDLFRMEVNVCQSGQLNVGRSELGNISTKHEFDTLATENPTSCNLRDLDKFHDISSCSFEEVLSDGNDGSVYTLPEMLCSPKDEKNEKIELTGKDSETSKFEGRNELATISAQGDRSGTSPVQKRSRKPTQRYIDEFEDPILRFPKKRRGVSSSTHKIKDQGAKGHKKCRLGSSTLILPVEETSVKAIQVPFAAVVRNECPKSEAHDMVRGKGGNLIPRPKDSRATPDNQNKGDECITPFHKKRSHIYVAASEKRREDGVSVAYLKKRSERHAGASQKKRGDFIISMSPKERVDLVRTVSEKKRDDFVIAANPKKNDELAIIASDKKGDDCYTIVRRKNIDDFITSESIEVDVSVRRKHHILWTIAEVKKLLDGVSQYGVGRWSRIKKLFFSQSAHRTSVDLKDKWRNLLKASGILERGKGQGRKKRNAAWRPLPKSILGQVCELAAMHPYPKGQRPEISHNTHDSPDRSTDITLSDYKEILRSISSN